MKIILNSRIIDSIELIKKSSSTQSSKKELSKLIDYILDLDTNFCEDQKIFTNRD